MRQKAPKIALFAALLAGLALWAGAASAAEASKGPQITLDQAVDGLQKLYEKVTDFKAKFKQVVKRKHLPRPLEKRGTVFFKKPGMMRWDYAQPERVLYVSDGKVLWSYQPEDRLVYKMNVVGSELYEALKFLFGQGNLRKEFDITLGKSEGGLVTLDLVPKVSQSNYKKLVLRLDPKTFEIRETELVDPLDNVSRITFEKPEYEELKAEGFAFEPPAGVRVEDLQARTPAPTAPKDGP